MLGPRATPSLVACLTGVALVLLGAIIPYGANCVTCRVLAPDGVSFSVWLPAAVEPVLSIALGLTFGLGRRPFRVSEDVVAGMLIVVGAFTMARFLPYAVHPSFPGGGLFGVGGVVGVLGGAAILLSGVFGMKARRKTRGG